MRLSHALLSAAMLSATTLVAYADPFTYPTYPNPGMPTSSPSLRATASGEVTGVFISSNAGGEDTIRLFDVTRNTYSPWLLDNRTSVAGSTADFGFAAAGDVLVFEIDNGDLVAGSYYIDVQGGPAHPIMASDASYSADGDGHAFAMSYPAGTIPGMEAFTYMGMEDLPSASADFDYNDLDFLATNVSVGQVPEPGSFFLLGTGLLGVGGLLARKMV